MLTMVSQDAMDAVIEPAERQLIKVFSPFYNRRQHRCSARWVPANHELHDNMEQPGRCRAQSGRLAAKVSLSGCSS